MSLNEMVIHKNGVQFRVKPKNRWCVWVWHEMLKNSWEEDTFTIFDRFLHPQRPYLDIGAWIGPTVLYGAQRAKHVFAAEPDPVAFQELQENVSLNPGIQPKVTCIHAAVSAASGTTRLYKRDDFGNSQSSLLSTLSDEYCDIRAATIEELLAEHGMHDVNFVKIDIEAGEYVLIPAMYSYLKSYRPTLYLSFHPLFLSEHLRSASLQDAGGSMSGDPRTLTENVLAHLDFYKYIYDTAGNPVSKDDILNVPQFGQFVFTDERW